MSCFRFACSELVCHNANTKVLLCIVWDIIVHIWNYLGKSVALPLIKFLQFFDDKIRYGVINWLIKTQTCKYMYIMIFSSMS